MEIGCHSSTHISLINKEANLFGEIKSAKSTLEQKLNKPVNSFCYPYGHFNDRVIQMVADSFFDSATTMIRSRATATHNSLKLPRIPITWHTMPHLFLAKVLTNYEDNRRHA
jgi:peptidoglycan/xylan/chitin deacetylase (PgdA/CDA1 family)